MIARTESLGIASARRLFLKRGDSLGLAIISLSLLLFLYLWVVAERGESARSAWPTEGFYFGGAQYQLSLQSLRIALLEYHQEVSAASRIERRDQILLLRDVLHAKHTILTSSPDLAPHMSDVPGYKAVAPLLWNLNTNLDALVADALSSTEGLNRFNAVVEPVYQRAVTLVNDLRISELSAFEAAFVAQSKVASAYQFGGLLLMAALGYGMYKHVRITRKEISALEKEAEARAEAQRNAHFRTALLGMVSHELRTPLQTMLTNVELLSLHDIPPEANAAIERLERGIELISGQLDNLAQFARLTSATAEIRRERFSLTDLLRRIVEESRPQAKGSGQSIDLHLPADGDVLIQGDPIRLHQVVSNFLGNAMKYAGPCTLTVGLKLLKHRFAEMTIADAVEITVEDDGPGIPDADQQSIWEPFVRVRRGTTRPKGSGLGLAVVKLLSTSAGWEVGVRSQLGNGACFFVILPMLDNLPAATSSNSP